jgi:hypothetical protein
LSDVEWRGVGAALRIFSEWPYVCSKFEEEINVSTKHNLTESVMMATTMIDKHWVGGGNHRRERYYSMAEAKSQLLI